MGPDERKPHPALSCCRTGQVVVRPIALTPDAVAWLSVPGRDQLDTLAVRSRPDFRGIQMRSELTRAGIYHLFAVRLMVFGQFRRLFSARYPTFRELYIMCLLCYQAIE